MHEQRLRRSRRRMVCHRRLRRLARRLGHVRGAMRGGSRADGRLLPAADQGRGSLLGPLAIPRRRVPWVHHTPWAGRVVHVPEGGRNRHVGLLRVHRGNLRTDGGRHDCLVPAAPSAGGRGPRGSQRRPLPAAHRLGCAVRGYLGVQGQGPAPVHHRRLERGPRVVSDKHQAGLGMVPPRLRDDWQRLPPYDPERQGVSGHVGVPEHPLHGLHARVRHLRVVHR
mmetsp:Transcript_9469/g.32087  ORF Transcript_9469/g.32087 Transcript_9469/m.32087 type:complete len:224 (+) Transcript_9469:172-843(+)